MNAEHLPGNQNRILQMCTPPKRHRKTAPIQKMSGRHQVVQLNPYPFPHAPVHAMIYTVGSSQTLERGSAQRSLPQAGHLKVFMPAATKNSEIVVVAALAHSRDRRDANPWPRCRSRRAPRLAEGYQTLFRQKFRLWGWIISILVPGYFRDLANPPDRRENDLRYP